MEIKDTQVYNLERAIVSSGFSMDTGDMYDNFNQYIKDIKTYFAWRGQLEDLRKGHHERVENARKRYERACWLGKKSGTSGECNFLTGILVTANIKYPLYLSKQLQRYHFLQIVSSSSTMHRLTTMDLSKLDCDVVIKDRFINLINTYNNLDDIEYKKEVWLNIVKSCPSGLELFMHFTTNYLQLKNMYNQRKNHKLHEWHTFCDWINSLPYFNELCLGGKNG